MNWKEQYKSFLWILGFFLFAYFIPTGNEKFNNAIFEAFSLAKWYAQEHVLLCLVPAFFIAGVISVFVSQAAVIKYFGAKAKKWLAYLVASVSGTILAVCSCTVLPLFSGIHKRGAGLGPAIAFLYSGPAINILAIILTARILGFELGIARVIGAVVFSIVIGLIMSFIYRKEEKAKKDEQLSLPEPEETRPIWKTAFHFFVLVAILVFANWGKPDTTEGFWYFIYTNNWLITGLFGLAFAFSLIFILKLNKFYVITGSIIVIASVIIFSNNPIISFTVSVVILTIILSISKGEPNEWMGESWGFAKQILPLLGAGVLVAGFLLGAPSSSNGIIPNEWISNFVGGNSVFSNFFASIVGAFMYFATLTEVPILQGLINNGMGKGPALALLLAGPALSLPNMLVIRSVIGTQKTIVYVTLVVVMATTSGLIFGAL
ncbi:MAG: permease [Ignavibacteria bacterium]|nr:permease [Bacteroidota bacterium]MBL7128804.1 permease [Ignavibacteria bacterium]